MLDTPTFHRWHIDVLLAVRELALSGRIPCNEEDLAAQLGYADLDAFEKDSAEIEAAIQDLAKGGLLQLDQAFCVTITETGQDLAGRMKGLGE